MEVSKVTRKIKNTRMILLVMHIWMCIMHIKKFDIVVYASNETGMQSSKKSMNNSKDIIYKEQLDNSYSTQEDSLNNKNTTTDGFMEVSSSNPFNSDSMNNPYAFDYYMHEYNYTYNSYNFPDEFLDNTPDSDSMNKTQAQNTCNSLRINKNSSPEPYSLFELNSTEFACSSKEPDIIPSNLVSHSQSMPSDSNNEELHKTSQSLDNPCTSTSRKRKSCSNNNTDTSPGKLLSITSSVESLDDYTYLVETIHNYKLELLKNKKEEDISSAPMYFNHSISNIKAAFLSLNNVIRTNGTIYNNVWIALMASSNDIFIKLKIIIYLATYKNIEESLFTNCKLSYYHGVISDLNRKYKSCYSVPKRDPSKFIKVEADLNLVTLGSIYAKRNINLLWHAESMLMAYKSHNIAYSSYNTEETEEDWNVKHGLLLILCLPEVYEDLFYMKYEDIGLLKQKILNSSLISKTKKIASQFCIIEYLYGKVHNNHNIMKKAYADILNIELRVSIYERNSIELYMLAYNTFVFFYKNSFCLYETNTDSHISNTSTSEKNENICPYMKQYTKIHPSNSNLYQGKGIILTHNKKRCIITFEYTNKKENIRILDRIENKQVKYNHINEKQIDLGYSRHYHIQLVDNGTHRMHILHLPFFVTNENGTIKYHYIHTIQDILEQAKFTFYSKSRSNSYGVYNDIYPFKYNRKNKTWSLVTRDDNDPIKKRKVKSGDKICDMDKTLEEMHNDGFDVVFYYIKEDIRVTEFVFAQFNPIDAETVNAAYKENEKEAKKLFDNYKIDYSVPRIPIFLPKLMTSAVHFGPYVLKSNKFKIMPNRDYMNPVPIEFSNWLDTIVKKKDLKMTIIELLNKCKHEIYYYSDFYILGLNTPYEDCDCYSMEILQSKPKHNRVKIFWCVEQQHNIGEYNNYYLDLSSKPSDSNGINKKTKVNTLCLFLKMIQRKHPSQDMLRYGLCICTRVGVKESVTIPLVCLEMKSLMDDLFSKHSEMHHMLSPAVKENIQHLKRHRNMHPFEISDISNIYISIKRNNYTKSKLGLHYNLMSVIY
ncbi:hypothetical protein NEPAR06_0481 [Nematocida parisii]|uniref:Uncharacterized protein n=1 Tax=Nematocida parisii (strain ERTm3) TaxID=935791 RepID=I3EJH5_NEMP3|nr:uncharacterized protein NEPG_01097 [Nematocida parisii ERTm1]EIJ89372.1 hypothetical protein NEQG_00142 [Nematocida parisii ERTm3]KAI5142601.1 hypothetical protein NEPAR07_0206 [Nematocida parisii]EIJ94429.1 hypothetical protein NEPG_01097 [Nematocida parisii ERTm1]KAI5153481.1 hypothetical protein NEPAR06_0481 [Nematocida parisii]KAI5156904.1 hypothetical protein NEPAR05_0887 [Nematocida parisii]|eukprot:XP_013058925.1 hypothetical protein NEPG_01097 [Nematocida parisii ERTm1]